MTNDPWPRRTQRVPLALPNIGQRERELVEQVLRSDTLAMGPLTETFERELAAVAGRGFGIACSSGTAGLHLAVRGLGIGEGDEVITTPFSFVASSNCILYERAIPRFVDIEEETLGIDPELASSAVTARTRAVLPVDVFGNPCRLEELEALARERSLAFIEDSCEAVGSRLRDRPLGSFGDAAVFAFYPNKQITTGEGGMVVTDDADLATKLRSMRNQGRDADGTWLRHVQLGYNYRMDELSAALGVAQLEKLGELREGRARVAAMYDELLCGRDWLTLPKAAPDAEVNWFVYVVRVDEEIDRDRLIDQLDAKGVPARPYFSPIHLQPFYRDLFGFQPGSFPIAERVAASTLALPFSSRHSADDVRYVADALVRSVEEQFAT